MSACEECVFSPYCCLTAEECCSTSVFCRWKKIVTVADDIMYFRFSSASINSLSLSLSLSRSKVTLYLHHLVHAVNTFVSDGLFTLYLNFFGM